ADGARERAVDRVDGQGVRHPPEGGRRVVPLDGEDAEHAGRGAAGGEEMDAPGRAQTERPRRDRAHAPGPGREGIWTRFPSGSRQEPGTDPSRWGLGTG